MALKKEQLSLKKWSDQKWRTSDGSESKGKKRYLPDRAWDALSPQEKAATNRAKSEGNKEGEQFVAQPKEIAKKTSKYRKINEELVLRIRHLAKGNPEIHAIDAGNQDLFSFRKYEKAEEVIPALVEEAGAAAGGASGGTAASGATGTSGSAPASGGDSSSGGESTTAPSEGESGDGQEPGQEAESKDNQAKAPRSRYYHIPGFRAGFVSPYPFIKFSKKKKKKKDEEDNTVSEQYYQLNEAKASDIKGTGRISQLAREYLAKYPTKFTFRANKHVETLEKYLGKRAEEVVKVVIGGHYIFTYEGPVWTGTAAVAFTNDKIFVSQKGLLFGTENVKMINRDKIDDVQISRGVIYGMFTIHARSEHLVVGVIHKNALQELQDFLEKYADSKIKIKQSQEPDTLSKQVVNESLIEAAANLSEEFFAVEVEKAPGETHSETIEADTEKEAITKIIEKLGIDVENIKHLQRINEAEGDDSDGNDSKKPTKKSEVDDFIDDISKDSGAGMGSLVASAISDSIKKGTNKDNEDWDAGEEEKPLPDRIVPQEEIDAEEASKAEGQAYQQQRLAGMKANTPFIDDYGSRTPDLYFRDPKTGQMFKKQRPVDPKTGKMMGLPDYMKQTGWNEPDPEGTKDPRTGETLVGKDGKPLLNSAPVGDERYILTEKLTRPHKGENKQEFISRFMSDKLAGKEFKDNKQRVAVAYNQWERGRLRESEIPEALTEAKRHPLLVKHGVEGFNKPKRTPGHKTKSHLVVAKKDGKVRVVRFGAQGAHGSPSKEGESESWKKRRQNWVKRHKAQNAGAFKDKFSALYWANKVKW